METNKQSIPIVRVGIHQPNFFPWLGYLYKMKQSDVFVILDTVDIVLGSSKAITHRAKIKTKHGDTWLTIPLVKGNSKRIKDLQINTKLDWKAAILNQLEQQYRNAPNFEFAITFVKSCLDTETDSLAELNFQIIKKLASLFQLNCQFVKASDLTIESDDRNLRLIEIIKKVNGSIYISGKGGQNYHDESLFEQENIRIERTHFQELEYVQQHGAFSSGLSCIDYIFNTINLKLIHNEVR